MMGTTHQLVGASLTATTLMLANVSIATPEFIVGLMIGWTASVLPDIDGDPESGDPVIRKLLGVGNKQTSKNIGKAVRRITRSKSISQFIESVGSLLLALIAKLVALVVNLFAKVVSHRGFTHWGITWICSTVLIWCIAFTLAQIGFIDYGWQNTIALSYFVGYGSHIACDMGTRSGIEILGPFSGKSFHLLPKSLRVKTGSWQETIFTGAWMTLFVPLMVAVFINKGGV